MSATKLYDLLVGDDALSVISTTDKSGIHYATCMWMEDNRDQFEKKEEVRASTISEKDALDQIVSWANDNFGVSCDLVSSEG